ncbi:hypothetical protein [Rhodoligotrophos ferricapiens]|uniref:hypothetical protein n=1 Tax=Rhodoligotrophos ferricapiens TaxID=3069264 RepID=UPI00315D200B
MGFFKDIKKAFKSAKKEVVEFAEEVKDSLDHVPNIKKEIVKGAEVVKEFIDDSVADVSRTAEKAQAAAKHIGPVSEGIRGICRSSDAAAEADCEMEAVIGAICVFGWVVTS